MKIANHDGDAHGYFGDEGGETYSCHVPQVAQREHQRGEACFQTIKFQRGREPDEIDQRHDTAHGASNGSGYRRAFHTHAEREDEDPVEHDVGDGAHHLYQHGVARRTIEAHQHHAFALPKQKHHARHKP